MWYRNPKWCNRLIAEQLLMHERFPQFRLLQALDGCLVWRGVLVPVAGSSFEISITVPARYPYEVPELRSERPAIRSGAPHLYANGTLCVHRSGWDPMRGTVASLVPLAAAWLVGYLHWTQTGEGF